VFIQLSESEGGTPGSVPVVTDEKAIEGAASSRAESASVSDGSSNDKSPTDVNVDNHIQRSEESGGDDLSSKDKSKGARKKSRRPRVLNVGSVKCVWGKLLSD